MATVTFDLDELRAKHLASDPPQEPDVAQQQQSYWSPEFHTPDNLLREEHWAPPIRRFLLPGAANPTIIQLRLEAGTAVLRLVEEVKMYANLEAEITRSTGEVLLDSAEFWDHQMTRIRSEWPESAVRGPWLVALDALEAELDVAVRHHGGDGAFIKLSARSPKDAVLRMSGYADAVTHAVKTLKDDLDPGTGITLDDEVRGLKRASWETMRVRCGADALALLVRSDRVYTDVLCHELFCSRAGAQAFQLDIFVHGWFPRLDPEFEFRGFVKDGKRTGLSAYNPWIYNPVIHTQKARILEIIQALWTRVEVAIPPTMRDYTIDFAVDPSLSGEAWIVELNHTLPPLAGACLFRYSDRGDRTILEHGPFEFRVLETSWDPVSEYAALKERGGKLILLPASPAWLEFARRAGGRETPVDGNPWDEQSDGDGQLRGVVEPSHPRSGEPAVSVAQQARGFWQRLWS